MSKKTISQTEGLCKEVATCVRNAYDRGYKQGEKDGYEYGYRDGQNIEQSNAVTTKEEVAKMEYERGLNDAWECTRKVIKLWMTCHGTKLFGTDDIDNIFSNISASDCIAKINEYEEKKETQKIKVGDIVTVGQDTKEFIVTWVGCEHPDEAMLITRNGMRARTARIDCLIKTGEHCDIEKCFKYTVF